MANIFSRVSADSRWAERSPPAVAIGLVTFGTLALELALIRWTSSQVRIFAYFNNIVLISAFLGIGLGVALGRRRPGLLHFVLPTLLVLALPLGLAERLQLTYLRFPDQSVMLWGAQMAPASVAVFARNMGIFLGLIGLVVMVFTGCGAALGCLFARLPALRAYHADLLGSLLGVLALTAAAWADAGPPVWLALGIVPFVWLPRSVVNGAVAAAVIGLGSYSVQTGIFSPYKQ